MEDEIREMAEEIFNTTSMLLAEMAEDRGFPPMYFIVKDKKLNPLVGAPGITVGELSGTAVNVAHEWDAEAIILICEQYMMSLHKDDIEIQDYLNGTKKPSESKDAKPYLTLIYMSKTGEAESFVGEIIKSLNGIRYVPEPYWIEESATNMITPWA